MCFFQTIVSEFALLWNAHWDLQNALREQKDVRVSIKTGNQNEMESVRNRKISSPSSSSLFKAL